MISPWLAIYLLGIHWVGDFLFQSREMAINKSKSLFWLSAHVGVYTCILFLGLAGLDLYYMTGPGQGNAILYVGVNGALHFVIDFFTSRLTTWLYTCKDMYWFWTVIGFDQFLHALCLLGTLGLLSGWLN